MKQIITIIISACFLVACSGKAQTKSNNNMLKNTSEVKAMMTKFKQQEHRLEINDCEIVYNDKSFFLGNTLEEIENVIMKKNNFNYGYSYAWKDIRLQVLKKKTSQEIDGIYIYMHDGFDNTIQPNSNIILINGIPLTKDMLFGDFLNSSEYTFDDFYFDKHSFYLKPANCKLKNIKINFESQPFYEYSGSGHMRIRGDFDPSQTNPIKTISIFQYEDE